MHHKMGEVICERNPLLGSFAFQGFAREGDVAQNTYDCAEGLDLGKAQHVCGTVLAAPFAIETLLLLVVGEEDREFGRALELGTRLAKRLQNGTLGQRIKILRPLVVIPDNGNVERRRSQRTTPSVAFSASFLAVSAS